MTENFNDFGFVATDEPVKINYNSKLIGLQNIIWPLLETLKKNPTKATLTWPNRVEKITELMMKIEVYVKNNS